MKWILRYLSGTREYGLVFSQDSSNDPLTGYVDSDFAKDLDQGRSTTGYLFMVLGNIVSWKSQLQPVVALSTTEAEFIALTEGVKEALWLKGFVHDLGIEDKDVVVYCDNASAIHLSKNSTYHDKTKHIKVRLYFIRDVVNGKEVMIKWVDSAHNSADMLTKVLPGVKFNWCVKAVGIS